MHSAPAAGVVSAHQARVGMEVAKLREEAAARGTHSRTDWKNVLDRHRQAIESRLLGSPERDAFLASLAAVTK